MPLSVLSWQAFPTVEPLQVVLRPLEAEALPVAAEQVGVVEPAAAEPLPNLSVTLPRPAGEVSMLYVPILCAVRRLGFGL